MTPRFRFLLGFVFLLGIFDESRAATADPDKDPQNSKLLEEARTLIDAKKPKAGIEKCEQVIKLFESHYANSKHKIYCARTQEENLGYLVKAAADMSKGTFERGKQDAIALSSTWSSAYYMKGYALQEL